jgi:hypothetical protein
MVMLVVSPRLRRRYTVGDALEDWLAHGTDGLSERTVTLYRGTIVKALTALLAGHNQTATTELVYRHQIVPVLTRGAEVMDRIFG